jgi:hypothetical protein
MVAVRGRSDFGCAVRAIVVVGVGAVAAAAALPACVDPPSLEQACGHAARVFRERRAACFGFTPMADEATLIERDTRACTLSWGAPGSRVGGAYWEACAGLQEGNCDRQCTTYPRGTRAAGAPCLHPAQCSTLACAGILVLDPDGTPNPRTRACGTCAMPLREGEACVAGTDLCEAGAPGLSCFRGVCRARGGNGSSCDSRNDCAAPWVCTSAGTCGEAMGAGEACVTSKDCFGEFVCDPASKLCANPEYALAGEVCDDDSRRCWIGACDMAAGATTGVCPIVLPDGSLCDPSDRAQVCDAYAYCFGGVCQIPDPAICG